jgi:methylglyoxal synthase
MAERKRIALFAHDNRKPDLLAWARYNLTTLAEHELIATGTTRGLLESDLGLPVTRYLSGLRPPAQPALRAPAPRTDRSSG